MVSLKKVNQEKLFNELLLLEVSSRESESFLCERLLWYTDVFRPLQEDLLFPDVFFLPLHTASYLC